MNREIDDRVVLSVLFGETIMLLLLTAVMVNVFGSVLLGVIVEVVHGVVRRTHDMCLDEDGLKAGCYLVASSYKAMYRLGCVHPSQKGSAFLRSLNRDPCSFT
ncbi:PRA1 family protein F3-like protein [Tanacetum coccineum]